jgi:hypothetical protein
VPEPIDPLRQDCRRLLSRVRSRANATTNVPQAIQLERACLALADALRALRDATYAPTSECCAGGRCVVHGTGL